MSEIVSAEQIEIIEVSIRSERFQDDKRLFVAGIDNDAPVAVELEIYENIYMPYLTGSILIQDDNDIYRVAEIKGTERVHIRFKSPGTDSEIEKVFIISTVQRIIKVNDQMSQLLLELTEDHGYFNELELINKSYNGTGVNVIEKILQDNTNKKLKRDYYKAPAQRDFRYIVPWQSSYQAINTVLNFITTDNNLPYFFFSSLTSDDLILTDLESILEREPFNQNDKPFTYSQGQLSKSKTLEDEVFTITNLDTSELNDVISLAKMGSIGASFESADTLSGQADTGYRIDMKQEYQKLNDAEIINLKNNRYPIDDTFRIDEKQDIEITELNSKKYSVLSHSPYDDINGLIPDNLTTRQVTVKNNFMKLLADNSFTITVPGLAFAVKDTNRSVGHQIRIDILKEGNVLTEATNIDERRSGNFIMIAKKHVFDFISETHNVVIKVGRITEPRRIN
jgi:hypothetical protein